MTDPVAALDEAMRSVVEYDGERGIRLHDAPETIERLAEQGYALVNAEGLRDVIRPAMDSLDDLRTILLEDGWVEGSLAIGRLDEARAILVALMEPER